MEQLLRDLQRLHDTMLAPQTDMNDVLAMCFRYLNMDTALYHMDMDVYKQRKSILLFWCKADIEKTLFTVNRGVYQNISNDQMNSLTEICHSSCNSTIPRKVRPHSFEEVPASS